MRKRRVCVCVFGLGRETGVQWSRVEAREEEWKALIPLLFVSLCSIRRVFLGGGEGRRGEAYSKFERLWRR